MLMSSPAVAVRVAGAHGDRAVPAGPRVQPRVTLRRVVLNSVQSTYDATEPALGRRGVLAAVLALAALTTNPAAALAEEAPLAAAAAESAAPQTVYFGNGCFWGRQKEFVDAEKTLGRAPDQVSAVVGYAGGKQQGPGGKVCYYYGPSNTVYEKLGHAEVVQLELQGGAPGQVEQQMRAFADTYFSQFVKTPFGMMRSDPMDAGPGYRNVVGIPGGTRSSLFKAFAERNVNGMELREGGGNDGEEGREGDKLNVVWIVDSTRLPFYRAEDYHQFHDGIGKPFSPDYKVQQRRIAAGTGRIGPTGCPEAGGFMF